MSDAMPSARPLRWWSTSQLAVVGGAVQRVLAAWGEDWSLAASVLECVNASAEAGVAGHGASWQRVAGGAPSWPAMLWASLDGGTLVDAVEAGLFGREAPRPAGVSRPATMAAQLAEEAVDDLASRLAAAFGRHEDAERGTAAPSLPTPCERAWSGAVRIAVAVGTVESSSIGLRLDASVVSVITGAAPRPPAMAAGALTDVGKALATHRIRVRAMFEAEGVSLRELLALRPGDVLVTPHGLEATLSIVALNEEMLPAATICGGRLGARGANRAVALAPLGAA